MTEFEVMAKEMANKPNTIVLDHRECESNTPSIISIYHEDSSEYHAYYDKEGRYIGSLLIATNGKMTMMGVKEK